MGRVTKLINIFNLNESFPSVALNGGVYHNRKVYSLTGDT